MPQPEIEGLEKGSKKGQVSAAVSACIQREMQGGRTQEQATAMCLSMSREKTGEPEPQGGR